MGHRRPRRRDAQGDGDGRRRHAAGAETPASGGEGEPGRAAGARGGRRDRRDRGGAAPGRGGQERRPGRAGAGDRRPRSDARPRLPDARLLGVHPGAEDGVGGRSPEDHPACLQRGGERLRSGGPLLGARAPQAALHRRGPVQRVRRLRPGVPADRARLRIRPGSRDARCGVLPLSAGGAPRSGGRCGALPPLLSGGVHGLRRRVSDARGGLRAGGRSGRDRRRGDHSRHRLRPSSTPRERPSTATAAGPTY